MFNNSQTEPNIYQSKCMEGDIISQGNQFKLKITGANVIIGGVKFYRYPLNLKAIYEDGETYSLNDPRNEFANGYGIYPGSNNPSSWSKKIIIKYWFALCS